MNQFDGCAKPVRNGYHAMIQTAADAEAKPIMNKGGEPVVFVTELDAVKAVIAHILKYFNGLLVRDGEVAGRTKAEVEANFKGPLKQKGKTRVITVSYKGKGRKCLPSKEAKAQAQSLFVTPTEPST